MTPTFTRGPGESLGVVRARDGDGRARLRSSGIDPVELRLRNHTPVDPRGNPWSSDGLPECLRLGAERFGWAERDPAPRSHARRRLADRHRHGRRRVPDRVLHARRSARGRASTPTAARSCRRRPQEFGTGVADDGDAGRRRRARRRACDDVEFQAGDTRPAQQHAPRSARPARRWSAPPCTPPAPRCASSSSRWRSRDEQLAAARRRPGVGRRSRDGRMTSRERPGRGETYGELLAAQPPGRRRGASAAGARRRSTRRTGC